MMSRRFIKNKKRDEKQTLKEDAPPAPQFVKIYGKKNSLTASAFQSPK